MDEKAMSKCSSKLSLKLILQMHDECPARATIGEDGCVPRVTGGFAQMLRGVLAAFSVPS
jgi:hypothetical protein